MTTDTNKPTASDLSAATCSVVAGKGNHCPEPATIEMRISGQMHQLCPQCYANVKAGAYSQNIEYWESLGATIRHMETLYAGGTYGSSVLSDRISRLVACYESAVNLTEDNKSIS